MLSVTYTYKPKGRQRVSAKRIPLKGAVKVFILAMCLLPWMLCLLKGYLLYETKKALGQERRKHERLVSEWEALTKEEVVRKKVAPFGLHKPTRKEVVVIR